MAFYSIRVKKIQLPNIITLRYCSKNPKKYSYKRCYQILEIPETSTQNEIRRAYIAMVKRYHPDSCTDESSTMKFQEIDIAFKTLMEKKFQENAIMPEQQEEQDIMHTAPQHRQYLTYEGVGCGNPFQREKQYLKSKALKASENIMNHRLAQVGANETAVMEKSTFKHNIKTKYGFERLVEDLIQEGMSKGHFDKLSGFGKPLRDAHNKNPYVDYVTHKLNEILIENGFTPEWITLQKEIREELEIFRHTLCRERVNFPPYPLSVEENIKWSNAVYKHKDLVDEINRKINKYNLLVPVLQRQMLLVSLKNEAQEVLIKGRSNKDIIDSDRKNDKEEDKQEVSIAGIFNLFFKKSN